MEKRMVCKCEDEETDRSKLHNFRREGEGGFSGHYSKVSYIEVAKILKQMSDGGTNPTMSTGATITSFVKLFEADNPKFDSEKFREYIGF